MICKQEKGHLIADALFLYGKGGSEWEAMK